MAVGLLGHPSQGVLVQPLLPGNKVARVVMTVSVNKALTVGKTVGKECSAKKMENKESKNV